MHGAGRVKEGDKGGAEEQKLFSGLPRNLSDGMKLRFLSLLCSVII